MTGYTREVSDPTGYQVHATRKVKDRKPKKQFDSADWQLSVQKTHSQEFNKKDLVEEECEVESPPRVYKVNTNSIEEARHANARHRTREHRMYFDSADWAMGMIPSSGLRHKLSPSEIDKQVEQ